MQFSDLSKYSTSEPQHSSAPWQVLVILSIPAMSPQKFNVPFSSFIGSGTHGAEPLESVKMYMGQIYVEG